MDVFNEGFETKLNAAIAAGRPPALINHDVPRLYKYAQKGALLPLDATLPADKAGYLPNALSDLSVGGKLYAYPWYNNVNVLVLNGELFRKAGLHPARKLDSLEQQLAAAKAIRAKTGVPGLLPQLGQIDGIMLGRGLPLLQNGKAVFNSPAHAALLRQYADAYKAGALAKENLFADDNYQASVKLYNSGRLAMMETAPTAVRRTRATPAPFSRSAGCSRRRWPHRHGQGGYQFGWAVSGPARGHPGRGDQVRALPHQRRATAGVFQGDRRHLPLHPRRAARSLLHPGRRQPGRCRPRPGRQGCTGHPHFQPERRAAAGGLKEKLVDSVEAAVTGRKDAQLALDEAAAFWNRQLR